MGAIVAAVALSLLWVETGRGNVDPTFAALVSYLLFWIPLLSAVLVVRVRRWGGSHPIAWRVSLLDVLLGLGMGFLLRTLAALIEFAIRGTIVAPSFIAPTGASVAIVVSWVVIAVIAPLLIAPIVEELFFRGTLLMALKRPGKGTEASVAAVFLAALMFALPHAIGVNNVRDGLVAFTSATVLGLGAGGLALATGRIGAPIIAHVTFNAGLLLLLVV
ncbi:hypothetical protein HDC94_002835 [Leifsonia sp. AK011]|uniref:CPBP family intramembrane glutamic endopeptidase n=1 Tax=Leifsonia sp. AK011 TaxID=2723075 RepID=UPI0015C8EE6E|nr:CPBP family intramembrane glutamic endopeptidase [Leifsonia sp. AK011]NYF11679.1 hypothetical protein [Leifsonia sp. AK011]